MISITKIGIAIHTHQIAVVETMRFDSVENKTLACRILGELLTVPYTRKEIALANAITNIQHERPCRIQLNHMDKSQLHHFALRAKISSQIRN